MNLRIKITNDAEEVEMAVNGQMSNQGRPPLGRISMVLQT